MQKVKKKMADVTKCGEKDKIKLCKSMQAAINEQVSQVAHVVERAVDAEIDRIDNLGEDDLQRIRQERMKEIKKMATRKEEWKQIGHGQFEELKDEKEFFEEQKKSERFVCHFYRESTFRCKILNKHLDILAKKHIETRFVKIDAERCMWLAQRLKINVLPTIACIKDSKTKDFIVGFDDLGGVDDFPTEMLEWRLSVCEMLDYKGDKPKMKEKAQSKVFGFAGNSKKNLRARNDDSDDTDEED